MQVFSPFVQVISTHALREEGDITHGSRRQTSG